MIGWLERPDTTGSVIDFGLHLDTRTLSNAAISDFVEIEICCGRLFFLSPLRDALSAYSELVIRTREK